MTLFDYLVVFVLSCSVLIGLLRGLVKEVLSLTSWIVALVVANKYGDALAQLLPELIPGSVTRLIVAFLVLFIGVRLLMMLLTMTLESVIKASGLTVADRVLGSGFGAVRGLTIILVVVLLCGTTSIPKQAFWTEAILSPLAEAAARAAIPFLPGDLARHVQF
ncbi:CvpA family protein [Actimicrobium antarcticum]|uniref:Colicin V production protein n=1 Tax=Actimicrobium antarcticum TaxID=1051899 RepID=A0ABP7T299_9BURK